MRCSYHTDNFKMARYSPTRHLSLVLVCQTMKCEHVIEKRIGSYSDLIAQLLRLLPQLLQLTHDPPSDSLPSALIILRSATHESHVNQESKTKHLCQVKALIALRGLMDVTKPRVRLVRNTGKVLE